MNKCDSESLIISEWDSWWQEQGESRKPNPNDMSMFYLWLEQERPHLLTFRVPRGVDRWQEVRAMLNVHTEYAKG